MRRIGVLPMCTINFVESAAKFSNLERGFCWLVDIFTNDSFDFPRTKFGVLVRSYARPDAYRSQDLPQSLLDTFDARFAIQLANSAVCSPADGRNRCAADVVVE